MSHLNFDPPVALVAKFTFHNAVEKLFPITAIDAVNVAGMTVGFGDNPMVDVVCRLHELLPVS